MVSEIPKGTKGGIKQLFLKQHRAEILAYYDDHGLEATLKTYNMGKDTLEKLFRGTRGKLGPRYDKALILAEMSNQRSIDTYRELQGLKQAYSQFPDLVADALAEKLFKPLLSFVVKLPPEMEIKEDTRLRLDDVGPESRENNGQL